MAASVEIAGIGSYIPELVVTNDDLAQMVDTSDEWIRKRTGIAKRHMAQQTTAISMGAEAARRALDMAGLSPDDIGMIVVSTFTNEYLTPSMACLIQRELGIPECVSMDLSAGCTGFVYALVTAQNLMDALNVDAALVISSEVLSNYIDWTDRSTCVLFGDGAGAVVLKRSETNAVHCPILSAVPDTDLSIAIKRDPRHTPFYTPEQDETEYLHMKGREVFVFATDAMERTLLHLQQRCKDKPFTKIIPHQANVKIIDCVMRNTAFTKDQFFLNIAEYANTSSATIPIALVDAYKQGFLKKGDRVALIGFGAGLTYGGIVIDWTL